MYAARSRSEDDETLIKVNELPELWANPPVTPCQRDTRGEREHGWKFDSGGEELGNPAVALFHG